MSFTKLTDNLNIIQSLANRPTQEADALKAEFDKAGNVIKNYINETLIGEIEKAFESAQEDILQKSFPIGSRYVTQQNINPNTILGFGTWERSQGKIYVGLDENDTHFNEIGKTGGETEHVLTVEEMASHYHQGIPAYYRANSVSEGQEINAQTGTQGYTAAVGGDQPHNNLQPYEVVGYMWIRRS